MSVGASTITYADIEAQINEWTAKLPSREEIDDALMSGAAWLANNWRNKDTDEWKEWRTAWLELYWIRRRRFGAWG